MRIFLENLKISNFALLENACFEADRGFNVITGETGAGKSILIGALSMVLGEWVGRDIVRTGADSCEVEAVFGGEPGDDIRDFLKERDLEEETLILRRKFFSAGKSKCYINDCHVMLATLKELGNLLIDIHSQNQHQTLLKKSNQMKILDKFAGNESSIKEIRDLWDKLNGLKKEKERRANAKDLTETEIERLKSEISEIDSANLCLGIDDEVEKDYKILSNAGFLHGGVQELYAALYDEDGAIIEKLSGFLQRLEELAGIDNTLEEVNGAVQRAVLELESASDNLRSYIDNIDFDPMRLEEVLALREKIMDLKRKYSSEISEILDSREDISAKISDFDNFDEVIKKLDVQIKEYEENLASAASNLTKRRKNAAKKLSDNIMKKLDVLGMKGAVFKIELKPNPIGPNGKEDVEFFISSNPGQPEMELSKIASGGEISRIMLAIKAAFADSDNIPILVFDEIDTGIGATVANSVGKEIENLSKFHQIMVITHMPQIAGYADRHVRVEKKISEGVTRTGISNLEGEDRVNEIARMLGGQHDEITDVQARKILGNSKG